MPMHFQNLNLCDLTGKLMWSSDFTTKCLEKLGLIFWKEIIYQLPKFPSEMFHNVKLNKLWNNIDWLRKLIEFSASKPSPDGTGSTSALPPLERCCTWWTCFKQKDNPPNCQPTTHRAVSFKRQCLLFVESVDLIFSCYFFLIVVLVSFFLCINFTTIYKFVYFLFCLFLFVCLLVLFYFSWKWSGNILATFHES